MAVLIKNSGIIEQLERHSKAQDVPTTKGRLAVFIIREVLDAAEQQKKRPGQILRELRRKSSAA